MHCLTADVFTEPLYLPCPHIQIFVSCSHAPYPSLSPTTTGDPQCTPHTKNTTLYMTLALLRPPPSCCSTPAISDSASDIAPPSSPTHSCFMCCLNDPRPPTDALSIRQRGPGATGGRAHRLLLRCTRLPRLSTPPGQESIAGRESTAGRESIAGRESTTGRESRAG